MNNKSAKVRKEDWIHLLGPSDEELVKYSEEYQLPDRYLTGVNDEFEIARAEMDEDMLVLLEFMVIKEGAGGLDEYRTRALSMIHTDNRIITAMSEMTDSLEEVFDDLKQEQYLVYENMVLEIFSDVQKEIVEGLRRLHHDIDKMQMDIQKSSKSEELYRLIVLDKSLSAFQTAVENNREVLQKLSESPRFNESEDLKRIMHQVLIESKQAVSMVDEGIRVIELLNDVYGNVISNNLNNIMKFLTSLTIILTIPTLITGFYSMTVTVPGDENPQAYLFILIAALMISLSVFFLLRRKNFL